MRLIPVKNASTPLFFPLFSHLYAFSLIMLKSCLTLALFSFCLPSVFYVLYFPLSPASLSHPVLHSSLYLFLPTTFRRNHSTFLSACVFLPPTYHSNPIITEVMILWSLISILLPIHTSLITHRYTHRHSSEENQEKKWW